MENSSEWWLRVPRSNLWSAKLYACELLAQQAGIATADTGSRLGMMIPMSEDKYGSVGDVKGNIMN